MNVTIVCTGRQVDDRLQPHGPPCGKRLYGGAGTVATRALAAGWALTPDGQATCPTCRRPPPEVAALVREMRHG
jgi:hypothetical protein